MKIVVIEDRENVRELLIELIACDPELDFSGYASTVKEGINLIEEAKPHIALFDIELPDGNSFEILTQLRYHNFKVVFITSHEDYAIEAFRCSAVDYLLKPVDPDDFFNAIDKAKKSINLDAQKVQLQNLLYNFQTENLSQKKIVLNTANAIYTVKIDNILRCESDDSYTTFHLLNGKQIVVSKKLKHYEEILVPLGFVRVHRSHLINLSQLDYFDKKVNIAFLINETQVPVATRKQQELIQKMNG